MKAEKNPEGEALIAWFCKWCCWCSLMSEIPAVVCLEMQTLLYAARNVNSHLYRNNSGKIRAYDHGHRADFNWNVCFPLLIRGAHGEDYPHRSRDKPFSVRQSRANEKVMSKSQCTCPAGHHRASVTIRALLQDFTGTEHFQLLDYWSAVIVHVTVTSLDLSGL